jgi:hypothetical protein
MKPDLSSHIPTEILEQRAAEQRHRIHDSVSELKSSVRETLRERLDVESYTAKHLWPILGVASLLALVAGYGIAGIFARS